MWLIKELFILSLIGVIFSAVIEQKKINTLGKSSIKRDINRMGSLNLHGSNFWHDNKDSDCGFIKYEKFVHYTKCHKEVVITSTFGYHRVKCEELPYLVLYGTVHMKSGECSEIVKTNDLCEDYPVDGQAMLIPCRKQMRTDTQLIISVALLFMIIELIVLRWFIAVKNHRCPRGKLIHYTWDGTTLVMKLQKEEQKVVYRKRDNVDTSSVHSNRIINYEKFSVLSLVLLLCFIHKSSEMSIGGDSTDIVNYQLLTNSSLTIGDFHLTLHYSEYKYPLTKLYSTGKWLSSWWWDLDCQYSRCDPYGNCIDGGLHGIMGNKVNVQLRNNRNESYIAIRNCAWGNSKCWLTSGCDNIQAKITWDPDQSVDVYQIEEGFMVPHLTISKSQDCAVIQIRPLASSVLPDLSVIRNKNKAWSIGPTASKRGYPEVSKIGDLQWDSSGNTILQPGVLNFIHSSSTGWSVESAKSGYVRQVQDYRTLPVEYKGDHYSVRDGYLIRVLDSPVDISLACNKGAALTVNKENCGGIDMSVSGMVGSVTAVLFHVQPKFKIPNSSWDGEVPCIDKKVQMDCLSDGILIKVPWPNQCMLDLNLTRVNVVEQSGFIDLSESHSSFSSENSQEKDFFSNFWSLLSNRWTGTFLSMPPILLVVCVVFIFRR